MSWALVEQLSLFSLLVLLVPMLLSQQTTAKENLPPQTDKITLKGLNFLRMYSLLVPFLYTASTVVDGNAQVLMILLLLHLHILSQNAQRLGSRPPLLRKIDHHLSGLADVQPQVILFSPLHKVVHQGPVLPHLSRTYTPNKKTSAGDTIRCCTESQWCIRWTGKVQYSPLRSSCITSHHIRQDTDPYGQTVACLSDSQ